MKAGIVAGDFAHVAGTFDLSAGKGTIDYVTPVRTATRSADPTDGTLRLVGTDGNGKALFDVAVTPQHNSCAPHDQKGTFDDYVPVSPELLHLKLFVGGTPAADFTRGAPAAPAGIALGGPDPGAPHRFSLAPDAPPAAASGVTYTVQAKDDRSATWQTIAVGLPVPQTDLDANQFPGARSVSVRVLRSDGFSESEVFNGAKHF